MIKNKTILIIGSSGGIGSAISDLLIKENFNIALHYFENKPKIKENDKVKLYQADITKEEEVIALINSVLYDFKSIDVLINNAGISKSQISWKTELTNWENTLAVNLTGPFLLTKHVLPVMKKNNFGRIIFISSIVAQTGFIGTAAYAASKAGLLGLTKTLAKESAPNHITVNSLALGYFNTGMIHDVPEELQNDIKKNIPKQNFGDPKAIFQTLLFLIQEESNYITGQTINLNGGLFMS